jgi:UDP-arabinose 4-epimerase
MKKVLVTGGAGYIGSHACLSLSQRGFVPVVYDSLERGHADAVRWGPLVKGDVRDRRRLARTIARHRPVAVMHFAAMAVVPESVSSPDLYWDVNVSGTLALIEAMRHKGGPRLFVFSSTAAVYGQPRSVPIREDHPLAPMNPYGDTKLAMEMAIRDLLPASGARAVTFRYFNAAGGAPDHGLSERHDPETHLVPLVVRASRDRRRVLSVFGDDYPTPDGTCIRDYVHVLDIAEAHVTALLALLDGHPGGTYNLGTGRGSSVNEVIGAAGRALGRRPRTRLGPRRPGDPATLVADPALAMRELGWRPRRSDLATIIADASA